MNWLVGLDQAAEPCCPWPGQCSCRPAARRTLRVKVPHQALRQAPRPQQRAQWTQPQIQAPRSQQRRPQPFYAAPAPAPAFDLNVSGDNWEVVLADLAAQGC